ncbi:hypothetical protein ACH4SP_20105 [Streptomyces sp. NPDC021093]|uniref:hypothetical protein n=1 Tax=Streptomyces sp. NPDC021093 TaxID=3365112 RepID=UPI0037A3C4FD
MRTRTLRAAAVGLAASSVLLATACGGSTEAEEKPAAKKTPAAAKPSTPPAVAPLTQRQVESALLEVRDMPTGWSKENEISASDAGNAEFGMGKSDKPECQFLLDAVVGSEKGPKPQNSAVVGFTKSQEGPILVGGVTAYTEAEAKKLMKEPPLPPSCRSFTGDFEGDKVTVAYEDLSVPKAGQDSQGLRLKLTSDDPEMPSMQYDIANARVGGAIATTVEMSFLKADTQAFAEAFTKSVAKVEKVTKAGPEGKKA